MKKGISVLLIGILMISLTACGGDVSEKMTKRYKNLESYTATAIVTVNGNKGFSVYEMRQSYKAPDIYRIEVQKPHRLAGTVSLLRGKELWLKSGETATIPIELEELKEETDFLFLDTFLKDYFHQEPVPKPEIGADGAVLLSAPVTNPNRYRFHQNLVFDGESLLPKAMITYDRDGNEAVRVEYRDFVRNASIDEEILKP